MFRAIVIWAYVFMLFPLSVGAQNNAVGTGGDGCYFGKCETDTPTPTPNPQPNPTPQPAPTFTPLVCTTHFGTCQMGDNSPAGMGCNCPFLAEGAPAYGVVQAQQNINYNFIPNTASICRTFLGSCGMSVQIGRFESCYCPFYGEPVYGVSE